MKDPHSFHTRPTAPRRTGYDNCTPEEREAFGFEPPGLRERHDGWSAERQT